MEKTVKITGTEREKGWNRKKGSIRKGQGVGKRIGDYRELKELSCRPGESKFGKVRGSARSILCVVKR